jgi:hypothetical protein
MMVVYELAGDMLRVNVGLVLIGGIAVGRVHMTVHFLRAILSIHAVILLKVCTTCMCICMYVCVCV